MTPAEVIRGALRLYESELDWEKGVVYDVNEDGTKEVACPYGAMAMVGREVITSARDSEMCDRDAQIALAEVIQEQFPDRASGPVIGGEPLYLKENLQDLVANTIVWFNDHPNTTFDEVRVVLEKAAIRLEEKGK